MIELTRRSDVRMVEQATGCEDGEQAAVAAPLVEALFRAEHAAAELSVALGHLGLLMLPTPDTEME
jgi:hypothetical protein